MFSNLVLYKLDPTSVDPLALEDALQRNCFEPCLPSAEISRGWVAPEGEGRPLVYQQGQQILVSLKIERKTVPTKLVKHLAAERAAAIEQETGNRQGRSAMKALREEIYHELLPRAFPKQSVVFAWLDLDRGVIAVATSSVASAESVLEVLNRSVDGLRFALMSAAIPIELQMSTWLQNGEAPAALSLDDSCELRNVAMGRRRIRYTEVPLDREDIRTQLSEGMVPTQVALTWDQRLSFVLTDRMDLRKLELLDVVRDGRECPTDKEAAFASSFALETAEYGRLIAELRTILGEGASPVGAPGAEGPGAEE